MKVWPKVALGELLRRSDESAVLDPAAEYHEVTIKLWGKGVISRGKVYGSDVVSVRRVVRANQLILSKIDARNGAIGLVPPELDGAIVSNDFPSFDFRNHSQCNPAFMGWLVRSSPFVELCKAASEGTTNRVRIKEDRFLGQSIALPPLAEQQAITARIDALAEKTRQVEAHLDAAECDAEHLLALRFRDAIANAPLRAMAEVAPLIRRDVAIDLEASYTELGVRSFYKGTFHRRTVAGSEFTWQKMFRVEEGDLIFSNIMAWEQAIALAKSEDQGCVGNHRMLTCVETGRRLFQGFWPTTSGRKKGLPKSMRPLPVPPRATVLWLPPIWRRLESPCRHYPSSNPSTACKPKSQPSEPNTPNFALPTQPCCPRRWSGCLLEATEPL